MLDTRDTCKMSLRAVDLRGDLRDLHAVRNKHKGEKTGES